MYPINGVVLRGIHGFLYNHSKFQQTSAGQEIFNLSKAYKYKTLLE